MPSAQKPGNHHHLSRLIESGNIDQAQQLAVSLSQKHPRDANIWFTLAGLYARQGAINYVIDCCEHVISINPGHARAHYNLAAAWLQVGQSRKAETCFRKCLDIEPANLSALLGMGTLLRGEGRQAEALPWFKKATDLRPPSADAFYHLGVTQQSQDDPYAATDAYRQAIRLRPDHFKAINNLGSILSDQGKFDEALELFARLVQLKPDLPQAHNNTGIIYESMGKIEEAETAFRKAIALGPSLAEPKTHLGFLLGGEGRTGEALDLFNKALKSVPNHQPAVAGKAVTLERLGRIEEAYATIEPAISAGSTDPDTVLAWCKIMLRKGKPHTGIQIAERLLTHGQIPHKGIADLHFALGDLYEKDCNYAAAFPHYEKANKASPHTYNHNRHVRYIDRIIHSTRKQVLDGLPKANQRQRQMVFIVGMPRSGTSLVEQILSSHPDVYGAGELRYISDIASSFSLSGQAGAKYPGSIGELEQDDINRLAKRYADSVDNVADESPAVIDKMPHNFLYLGLISLLLPGAKIIHVSRTPLDNCLSLYFHSFNPLHSYTTELQTLGQYYREYQRLMRHWQNISGISLVDIRYEDIVRNPEKSTRELLGFCGLDWSDACMNFHKSSRFVKTPSYDQVRRPVYSSSVDRWRHYRSFIAPLQAALET